jgi:hypothetical protein
MNHNVRDSKGRFVKARDIEPCVCKNALSGLRDMIEDTVNAAMQLYDCPCCGARFEMIVLREPQEGKVWHKPSCPFCCEFLNYQRWVIS